MKDVLGSNRKSSARFGWHYFNYLLIGGGLVVALVLIVLPHRWYDPKYQEALEAYERAEIYKKAKAAQDKEIAREREELGLIYIEPGTNPFQPAPEEKAKPQ